jgi:hypothetical protein
MTASHEATAPKHDAKTKAVALGTTAITIASIDVELPNKFGPGHVLTDSEAKALDALYRRQYANNKNAAFAAWEKKAKAWDESTASDKGERPVNPCTPDALLSDYVSYAPQVGASTETQREKDQKEAVQRAVVEVFAEHNAALAAGKPGILGSKPVALPKADRRAGITAEQALAARVALGEKLVASGKHTARVQRHLDAIIAEREATKKADAPVTAEVASVDEIGF